MHRRAAALIEALGLEPHPEGGHFRQIYRSAATVLPGDDAETSEAADARPTRTAVTSIYFLLAAGEHSRWHRVRSDEIWHFYEGDPLQLHVASPSMGRIEQVTLSGFDGPGRLVHAVPAQHWQAAQPAGGYSLVGCTVAPGFEFADFSFLRDDPARLSALKNLHPGLMALV